MISERWAQLRRRVDGWFPERRLYLRSGGEMRAIVLSPRRQMTVASVATMVLGWTVLSTGSLLAGVVALAATDAEASKTKARYERLIADRQARLDSAVAQLGASRGTVDELAATVESRHAALALVLEQMTGEAADAPGVALAQAAPAERLHRVRLEQEQLIEQAEDMAQTRADRLRLAFKLAGVRPDAAAPGGSALGGPLVESGDPRALAAVLDVDEDFAKRIQAVARNLADTRTLTAAAETLPFGKPASAARLTSSYGVRFDPFTKTPAFHSGQDFAGAHMSAIEATAPGVVSFAGVRSGYGNTVEVDHGRGFKTRYAHLARINVKPGQRVALGQTLGGMGSTGRSTGTHLHYEVWLNGRAQNPGRYLKAGEYVQQNS